MDLLGLGKLAEQLNGIVELGVEREPASAEEIKRSLSYRYWRRINAVQEQYYSDDPYFYKEILDPFIAGLNRGDLVLDLACGLANETRYLEQNGLRVVPLDIDDDCLRHVTYRYPHWLRRRRARMRFSRALQASRVLQGLMDTMGYGLEARGWRVQGDGQHLPLPPDQFDGVVCKHLFTFGSDEQRISILAEIRRVLRPGA